MTMNPLPPQAYTKDTLLKAYAWLMHQNPSIKEMATTPDILVSLFLKATRDGDAALDRPSIQNFKNELKSLAGLMGELDKPQNTNSHNNLTQHNQYQAPPVINVHVGTAAQAHHPNMNSNIHNNAPASSEPPVRPSYVAPELPPVAEPVRPKAQPQFTLNGMNIMGELDPQSLAMIREVKADFNLSDDSEALRMLIKIGYTRSKSLLK